MRKFLVNLNRKDTGLVPEPTFPKKRNIDEVPGPSLISISDECEILPNIEVEHTTRKKCRQLLSSTSNSDNDCNSVTNTELIIKKGRKSKTKQKFQSVWLQNYNWIKEKNSKPFCTLCQKILTNNSAHLERHKISDYHKKIVISLKNQVSINDATRTEIFTTKINKVKTAELKIIMFILQYNLAFTLVSPLIALIKSIATDSHFITDLKCGKSKATETVNTIILAEGLEKICAILRNQKFSLIIDETTDVSTSKCLALVVRYFDHQIGKVKDRFLNLIQLEKSDAKSIHEAIINFFVDMKIPITNLIGFASDNASVMMGQNNGVKKLLIDSNPFLYVLGCVCHSLHLCSSAASKKLPQNIEHMTRNIYTFFSHSCKRQAEFKEFQEMFNIKTHKILKTSSTRWLSLENVINRILEQWSALKHYFVVYQLENNDLAHNIYSEMNDSNKLYLTFLSYVLKFTNKINIEFQAEAPRIHLLLPTIKTYLITILNNFISTEFINKSSLNQINFQNEDIFLDLNLIYLGAKAEIIIKSGLIDENEISIIKKNCRLYYIELCKQIFNRINLDDNVLTAMTGIDPKNLARSVTPLVILFPNLTNEEEIEELDAEWRILLNQTLVSRDLELEEFWCDIFHLKNALREKMFLKLEKFIGPVLSFPHSSAAAERIFSQLNIIKDKKRNCLLTKTVNAVMVGKEMLEKNDASDWNPSNELLQKYQKK